MNIFFFYIALLFLLTPYEKYMQEQDTEDKMKPSRWSYVFGYSMTLAVPLLFLYPPIVGIFFSVLVFTLQYHYVQFSLKMIYIFGYLLTISLFGKFLAAL